MDGTGGGDGGLGSAACGLFGRVMCSCAPVGWCVMFAVACANASAGCRSSAVGCVGNVACRGSWCEGEEQRVEASLLSGGCSTDEEGRDCEPSLYEMGGSCIVANCSGDRSGVGDAPVETSPGGVVGLGLVFDVVGLFVGGLLEVALLLWLLVVSVGSCGPC